MLIYRVNPVELKIPVPIARGGDFGIYIYFVKIAKSEFTVFVAVWAMVVL